MIEAENNRKAWHHTTSHFIQDTCNQRNVRMTSTVISPPIQMIRIRTTSLFVYSNDFGEGLQSVGAPYPLNNKGTLVPNAQFKKGDTPQKREQGYYRGA